MPANATLTSQKAKMKQKMLDDCFPQQIDTLKQV